MAGLGELIYLLFLESSERGGWEIDAIIAQILHHGPKLIDLSVEDAKHDLRAAGIHRSIRISHQPPVARVFLPPHLRLMPGASTDVIEHLLTNTRRTLPAGETDDLASFAQRQHLPNALRLLTGHDYTLVG